MGKEDAGAECRKKNTMSLSDLVLIVTETTSGIKGE